MHTAFISLFIFLFHFLFLFLFPFSFSLAFQDDPQTFKRELASGLPTPSCHTATGVEMRRHPNPATLDGNSSISNGGEERTSGSKSSRKRRGTSDGKCQAGASDEVMNAALNGMVSRHGFPDTDSNITGVHMPFKINGMGNTDFLVFFIKKKKSRPTSDLSFQLNAKRR